MIQVISKTLDYKTGLTGSEVLTGTALKYGAYQGFICQTYTVVAIVTNSKGDDITDLLGLRGVTLSPGIYICVPKGESIYSISLASGSVVLYGIAANIERVPTIAEIIDAFSSRVTTDGGTLESTSCINGSLVPYYKDASFVLIPSGYKALKAYAQKPITGNGDLTWSRNSVANRTQSDGNIGSVAANVPRLSYMYGSCPALLLEPQRTNLLTYSQAFSDASWGKIGIGSGNAPIVTANAGVSPDGTTNASRVQFNCVGTTNSDRSILQKASISISNATNYAGGIYVKAYSSSEIGKQLRFVIEQVAAQVIIILTDSWQRVSATGVSSSTSTNYIIETRGTVTTNTTADVLLWGAQFEQGAYPTTYIPTTTAAATRLVDTFSRNNIYTNGLISASGGTWFLELRNNVAYTRDTSGTLGLFTSTVSTTYGFVIKTGTGTLQRLLIAKRVANVETPLYATLTDTIKVAIKWNGATADIFVNGTKQISATAFTDTVMEGILAQTLDVPKFIQAMALWPTPLSDATCIAMTQ